MGRMMQQRLGLDEEQATRLSEVVRTFEGQRRELAQREQETRQRVDALGAAGVPEEEAMELLQLQAELRMGEAQLFRAEQEALLEVLTASQVLELQDLRQVLGRRIRALRGGSRGGDSRGSRGPGPRPDGRIGERSQFGPRPSVS
jgi:Spy/CpxP family protein refolding chaperone